MSQDPAYALPTLTPADQAALARAFKTLESPNMAARIADVAGAPVNRVLNFLPRKVNRQLNEMVRTAIMQGLDLAVDTFDEIPLTKPATGVSSLLAGVTGGLSGMFGLAALAVELPLTTTLMLRAIADIARHEGEDLTQLEARLACLEVFAFGAKQADEKFDVGYYAARTLISKYTNEVCAFIMERGVVDASAPVMTNLVSELVSRFGLVVSDKMAAGAVPVIGAAFGATVNVIFMDHFQRIAKGHFTVRRLERTYGPAGVRRHYSSLALAPAKRAG
jgi:hypothetical protein